MLYSAFAITIYLVNYVKNPGVILAFYLYLYIQSVTKSFQRILDPSPFSVPTANV